MDPDLDPDAAKRLAASDQNTKRAADDALVIVAFYTTMTDGGVPSDLVDDLTRCFTDFWFGAGSDPD